jgi:hypothetical protein
VTLHANINVSDPEIPSLQLGRRFAPRGDVGIRWKISLRRLRAALNPVIGKNSVPSVLRIPARHVAAKTVRAPAGMRSREVRGVASEAARPVILDRLRRFVVRVVASSTPQATAAVAGAGAQGKLLDMTDHFESAS